MSQYIDTLEELREEKKRLKQEVQVARSYLDAKVGQTFDKSKQMVVQNISWPLAISSLAAFGAKQFSSSISKDRSDSISSSSSPTEEFNLTDGIQQGIAAMQQPGNDKWPAVFQVALKFFSQWISTKLPT